MKVKLLYLLPLLIFLLPGSYLLFKTLTACEPYTTECRASVLYFCSADGQGSQVDYCPSGCNEVQTTCQGELFCPPGETYCVGEEKVQCSPQGDSLRLCPECSLTCRGVEEFSSTYADKRRDAGLSDAYLYSDYYFDLNDESVASLAEELKVEGDPLESLRSVLDWTHEHIRYDTSTLTLDYCLDNTASELLQKGRGVCSTMSRVNIALLRSQGLAARSAVGCGRQRSCLEYATLPLEEKSLYEKFSQPPVREVYQGREYAVLGGGAHTWLEVWIPEYGWVYGESTSGKIHPLSCIAYDQYYTTENSYRWRDENSLKFCAIPWNLAVQCQNW